MGSHLNHDDINNILMNIDMNKKKINILTLVYILLMIINICIIIIGIKTFF
jgi:hypothetical protein